MRSMTAPRSIVAVGVVLLAVVLLAAPASLAAILAPGGVVVPAATTSPGGATQLATTGPISFSSLVDPAAYSGTLVTSVYNNDGANPFGLDKLTFTYVLSNNSTSRDTIERFVSSNYTGFQVDVGISGTGRAPSTVDRQVTGDGVGWDWTNAPAIVPGSNSTVLVIHTDATLFGPATDNIINTFPAIVASLGPVVPEPASLGMIALGLAGFARRRAR